MFYMIGILAFIVFMFFTLVFYKYLFRVCEKLKIKINKNILCIITIVLFYGSLILGMMNKEIMKKVDEHNKKCARIKKENEDALIMQLKMEGF